MNLYNDGNVWDIGEPSENPDMVEMAKGFSEGDEVLENLLLSCWKNNIKTFACCSGKEKDDLNAYISFFVDEKSVDFINKIINFSEKNYSTIMRCTFSKDRFIIYINDKKYIDIIFEQIQELIYSEKCEYNDFYWYGKIINDYLTFYSSDNFGFELTSDYLFGLVKPYGVLLEDNDYPDLSDAIEGLKLDIRLCKFYKWDDNSISDLMDTLLFSLIITGKYMDEFMKIPSKIRNKFIMKYSPSLAPFIIKMLDNGVKIDYFGEENENICDFVVNKETMPLIKRIVNYLDDVPINLLFYNYQEKQTKMLIVVSDELKNEIFSKITELSYQQDNPSYNEFLSSFVEFDFYATLRHVQYRLNKFNNTIVIFFGDIESQYYRVGANLSDILNHFNNTGEIMYGSYCCNLESLSSLTNILESRSFTGYIDFDSNLLKEDELDNVKK